MNQSGEASAASKKICSEISTSRINHQNEYRNIEGANKFSEAYLNQLILLKLASSLTSKTTEFPCTGFEKCEKSSQHSTSVSKMSSTNLKMDLDPEILEYIDNSKEIEEIKSDEIMEIPLRPSSAITDDIFETNINKEDDLEVQFKDLDLSTKERRELEDAEWDLWMEKVHNSEHKNKKSDMQRNIDEIDSDSDDIDIILKNVREHISKTSPLNKTEVPTFCIEDDLIEDEVKY